jgi:hypothetical protein
MCLTVPNSTTSSFKTLKVRKGCQRVRLPNFLVALPSGSKSINAYTPITAQPNPSWRATNVIILWCMEQSIGPLISFEQNMSPVTIDVTAEYNSTTLGPFSFQVFVLAAWTDQKFQGKSKSQAIVNHRVLEGRRKVEIVGKGCRKRPLSSVVAGSSQEIRSSKRAKKENLVSSDHQQDNSHRTLRSRKR